MSTKTKILIVILIVFVIPAGWLIWKWQSYSMVVLSSTDKIEYEEGENLRVSIKNSFKKNICFSSCYPYFLEKKNGQWESYPYGVCEKPDINKTCIEPGQIKIFEINLSFVEERLHRLALPVCVGCEQGEEFEEIKRFYSNEFTISEKKVSETTNSAN